MNRVNLNALNLQLRLHVCEKAKPPVYYLIKFSIDFNEIDMLLYVVGLKNLNFIYFYMCVCVCGYNSEEILKWWAVGLF